MSGLTDVGHALVPLGEIRGAGETVTWSKPGVGIIKPQNVVISQEEMMVGPAAPPR